MVESAAPYSGSRRLPAQDEGTYPVYFFGKGACFYLCEGAGTSLRGEDRASVRRGDTGTNLPRRDVPVHFIGEDVCLSCVEGPSPLL